MPKRSHTAEDCSNSSGVDALRARFHVHFGAGKLGLGLLLKSIDDSGAGDFLVVQRPSCRWEHLADASPEKIRVHVNGEIVSRPMKFVRGRHMGRKIIPGQGPYFALAEGGKGLAEVVRQANSFSCSLHKGIEGLVSVLVRLPLRHNPPKLYACENDHQAVERLALELAGRVVVVPCMVDRICSSRTIQKDGTIDVKTEPWKGQIVVLPAINQDEDATRAESRPNSYDTTLMDESFTPGSPEKKIINLMSDTSGPDSSEGSEEDDNEEDFESTDSLPFGGDVVVTTETEEQAKYFHYRKLLLVNGTHTTLAFLTLIKELRGSATPLRDMGLPGGYDLLDYKVADRPTKKKIWAWLVARCYMIQKEFPAEVLMSAHNSKSLEGALESLLDYAWTALQRFSHVPDTTGRVLSGGVVRRFKGRLKNVLESVDELKDDSPEAVLAAAHGEGRPEISARFMRKALEELVRDATPIAKEKEMRDRAEIATPDNNQKQGTKTKRRNFTMTLRRLFLF